MEAERDKLAVAEQKSRLGVMLGAEERLRYLRNL